MLVLVPLRRNSFLSRSCAFFHFARFFLFFILFLSTFNSCVFRFMFCDCCGGSVVEPSIAKCNGYYVLWIKRYSWPMHMQLSPILVHNLVIITSDVFLFLILCFNSCNYKNHSNVGMQTCFAWQKFNKTKKKRNIEWCCCARAIMYMFRRYFTSRPLIA